MCPELADPREEAIVQVKRCIRLDPQNPEWSERLCEFQKRTTPERRATERR